MYKVVNLVFILCLYIHILSCLIWYLFNSTQKWTPPLDFIYFETKIYEEDILDQYFSMLYHAVMAFGRNDICPRTSGEVTQYLTLLIYQIYS
jgi:hypothetical protein